MDEYYIVPRKVMESRVAQMQLNKEPPEAIEVLSLDNLTTKILRRNDISDWEKAGLLTSSLERFLALKPKAFNEHTNPVASPPVNSVPVPTAATPVAEPTVKKPRKSRSTAPRRQASVAPNAFSTPEPAQKRAKQGLPASTAASVFAPKKLRNGRQYGTGLKRRWITW